MNPNTELMEKFFKIGRLMHQSHHKKSKHCSDSCRGQGRVLSILKRNPQITQKELSALLDIRSQSLGELLVRLERDGCIIRVPSETDRRVLHITLTEQGMKAAGQAEKNKERSAELFDCLSKEEKEYLGKVLNRLEAAFEKEAGRPEDMQTEE
ncbi:MarR family winged helix-turn-helix transcriptional regulator [Lacrimispora defluvii]|uniref:MarR family transcriptional regulator n=1 Tax=Lacrimispora defluvii TaxID=2719233 RepID=A0ABX1VT63_9FIRM|nr:MarR family transcriptional regulator [Lacrimispora defluvii]NNJ31299.1 MarR family transcriptional regulator [Lacrimispora defluvii]